MKLQYRKFDKKYMEFVAQIGQSGRQSASAATTPGRPYQDLLPITTLASRSVTFPAGGSRCRRPSRVDTAGRFRPWQRWNDYGIGLLLEGPRQGEG